MIRASAYEKSDYTGVGCTLDEEHLVVADLTLLNELRLTEVICREVLNLGDNAASGNNTVLGYNNVITESGNIIVGHNIDVSGTNNIVVGDNIECSGSNISIGWPMES